MGDALGKRAGLQNQPSAEFDPPVPCHGTVAKWPGDGLQPRRPRFDSGRYLSYPGGRMEEAPDFYSGICGFESCPGHHTTHAAIVQRKGHQFPKLEIEVQVLVVATAA